MLAIGEGEASRIYRTTDGGATWTETFRNTEPTAFYNCMDFYPGGKRGLAVSDPVAGKFRIAATEDGGRSWSVLPDAGMPDSTGEANFSASGDCLTISGRDAWFGSGGAKSRIFHSTDQGPDLDARRTRPSPPARPPVSSASPSRTRARASPSVATSAAPANGVDAAATTRDGHVLDATQATSRTWVRTRHTCVVPFVVVGRERTGRRQQRLDGRRPDLAQFSEVGFHTLDCTDDGACWAAGGKGRVGTL